PLTERREHLASLQLRLPVRISEQFEISPQDMLSVVREQGLEGVVSKRKTSLYEPGKRSGSWVKLRINKAQELVVAGFIPGPYGIDSIIVGYYRGEDLHYVARARNGFKPATRRAVCQGGLDDAQR